MKTALRISTIVAAASLALGLLGASPANAAPGHPKPDDSGYIVVNPAHATVAGDGRVFYPTGPISDDTIVVIADADGSLPDGMTEQGLSELVQAQRSGKASATTQSVTPLTTYYPYSATSSGWSGSYTGWSAVGYDASAQVYYHFNAAGGTSQRNVGQGLGYYRGYNGGTFGTWSAWYNLGSATASPGGGAFVPWGNVIAPTKFRAQCATSTVCAGNFW